MGPLRSPFAAQGRSYRYPHRIMTAKTKTPPQCGGVFSLQRDPSRSVPDRHQSLELRIADQSLRVSPVQQTSWVGLPDPDASMVFQPLRQQLERFVIHGRWGQSRLTCCIHFHTHSWARERLTYVRFVTERRSPICLKHNGKTIQEVCHLRAPTVVAHKKARHETGFFVGLGISAWPAPAAVGSGNGCCRPRAATHGPGSSPLRGPGRPWPGSLWPAHRPDRRSLGR